MSLTFNPQKPFIQSANSKNRRLFAGNPEHLNQFSLLLNGKDWRESFELSAYEWTTQDGISTLNLGGSKLYSVIAKIQDYIPSVIITLHGKMELSGQYNIPGITLVDVQQETVSKYTEGTIVISPFRASPRQLLIPSPKLKVSTKNDITSQAINNFQHHLAFAVSGSFTPFGVTSDKYQNHVFWDADCWLFPYYLFTNPEAAKRIAEFRLQNLEQARRNYDEWVEEDRPTANKQHHIPEPSLSHLLPGIMPAKYPWESTLDGKEASPTETKFEEHISGDIAWMLDQAITFGLIEKELGEEAIKSIAAYYLQRMSKMPDGSFGLLNVVSPSEWNEVNNDLYTNLIADWTIKRATGNTNWGQIYLPKDKNGYVTFDDDQVDSYQQSAALLSLFPLDTKLLSPEESEKLYERFKGKHSPDGPAMSWPIETIWLARSGKTNEAESTFQKSWQDYSEVTSLQFKEKAKKGNSYFYTGSAGVMNSIIYGFLGFRVHSNPNPAADWQIKLDENRFLSVTPNLPDDWHSVSFKDVQINGKTYDFIIKDQALVVTEK